MGKAIIRAEDLSFTYPESSVGISGINFSIGEGEVILLTGNSGSGKSTLLKCLNGLIPAITEGTPGGALFIRDMDYRKMHMHELNRMIGSVFQNPRSQFFTENTTAELVFPMENYGFAKYEMRNRIGTLEAAFGLKELMDRDIHTLSSGERQKVALAASLTMNQNVLLFDEPSANLDYGNAMHLGNVIRDLKGRGMTIIVADHRFYYLNGIIDRVFFMENGHLTVYENEQAFQNSGYDTRSFHLFGLDIPFFEKKTSGEESAVMDRVSYRGILKEVSLTLYKGQVCALTGSNGSGKTTLARMLCKSLKPERGSVSTDGLPFFIMQDPDYQLFGTSAKNELTIVKNDPERIDACLSYLGLSEQKDAHPFDLSGGQKQRLQIGMAMMCDRELIIFDEPTSGLDVQSMQKVGTEIRRLGERASVFVISHDYEFIRHVADRILFLKNGIIEKDFLLGEDTLPDLNDIFITMQKEAGYEQVKN